MQLEAVAKELDLPLNDTKVLTEWCKRGGGWYDNLLINLIAPLYFPAPKYKLEWNEEMQRYVFGLNPDYKEG